MFKRVYITELALLVTRALRFREPVEEGYLRPQILRLSFLPPGSGEV